MTSVLRGKRRTEKSPHEDGGRAWSLQPGAKGPPEARGAGDPSSSRGSGTSEAIHVTSVRMRVSKFHGFKPPTVWSFVTEALRTAYERILPWGCPHKTGTGRGS